MTNRLISAAPPRIAVIGDFCLDKFLLIDEKYDAPSLNTGLNAHQATGRALYPGGAGCVVNNLRAMGAQVICVGVVGDDGEGYELLRALRGIGADPSGLIKTAERMTPAYIRPIRRHLGMPRELNRIDLRDHTPTPERLEMELITRLTLQASMADCVVIQDQFAEDDVGVVTRRVRDAVARLASERQNAIFYADSRGHAGQFRGVYVKCNQYELLSAVGQPADVTPDLNTVKRAAERLRRLTGKTVFATMGASGQVVADGETTHYIPAFRYDGPTDILGAGDACTAATAYALAVGMDVKEAARAGNAASSIAIRQLGVTGIATREGIVKLMEENA